MSAAATAKASVPPVHLSATSSSSAASSTAKPAQKITMNIDRVKAYDAIFGKNHEAATMAAHGLMHKLSGRALRPLPPSQSAGAVEKILLKEWVTCFEGICPDIATAEMRRNILVYYHFISDQSCHTKPGYTQSIQLGARLLINEWKNPQIDHQRKQVVFSCLSDLINENLSDLISPDTEDVKPSLIQRWLSPIPTSQDLARSLSCHSRLLEEIYYYADYLRDAGEGPRLPHWGDHELRLYYKMVAWHATDKEQILLTIFKRVINDEGFLLNHVRALIGSSWGLKYQTPNTIHIQGWPTEPGLYTEVLEAGYTSAHQIQKDAERLRNVGMARLARVALQETIDRCIPEGEREAFITKHLNDDPRTGFLDKEGSPNQLCVAFLVEKYGFQEPSILKVEEGSAPSREQASAQRSEEEKEESEWHRVTPEEYPAQV